MDCFIVLSKNKVHAVCESNELAEQYLMGLRDKCGLVPGYTSLWKCDYRIEIVKLNDIPKKLLK